MHTIKKLMLSMNQLDTHESVASLCGLVKEASQISTLCTFYTGVLIKVVGEPEEGAVDEVVVKETGAEGKREINSYECGTVLALCEKKKQLIFRL